MSEQDLEASGASLYLAYEPPHAGGHLGQVIRAVEGDVAAQFVAPSFVAFLDIIAAAPVYGDDPDFDRSLGGQRSGIFVAMTTLKRPAPYAHIQARIPDESDWAGYKNDLASEYLHRFFFGKSNDAVQEYFGAGGWSIERGDELLRAPRPVFQYYVHAFAQFVMSDSAAGDSDSASPFLALLEEREKRDPGSVTNIIHLLEGALSFVAEGQAYFAAPIEIYGDFKQRVARIRELCGI